MPELPDLTLYLEAIDREFRGRTLERIILRSPFLLRTVEPPITRFEGRTLAGTRRLGKRLIFEFGDALYLVLHLMIAGRFKLLAKGAALPRPLGVAALEFENATLAITEASKKKRAAMHLVHGESALAELDRGGLEPLECDLESFRHRLLRENRTLKRALTDPDNFAGIGNAYSDEILHRARLSPIQHTSRLDEAAIGRLFEATRATFRDFIARMRQELGSSFPTKVTAFRDDMAVHGRYGKPCPVCGTKVGRLVYAENESNYCPTCQTGGVLLADRALSRLLRGDWPRSWEELEERKRVHEDTTTAPTTLPAAKAEEPPSGREIPRRSPARKKR